MDPIKGFDSGLTQSALDELLRRLHSDPAEAGEEYLRLHDKLVSYFEFERCRNAADLADEVLDRVSRRLKEGENIERLSAYSLGVARLLRLETRQHEALVDHKLREFTRIPGSSSSDQEPALNCLDGCLQRLPDESGALILAYYSGERGERIENRKRLAQQLGMQPATLRNRALRLRSNLENCLRRCLRGGGSDLPGAK